jgi:hypothetical protein
MVRIRVLGRGLLIVPVQVLARLHILHMMDIPVRSVARLARATTPDESKDGSADANKYKNSRTDDDRG